MMTMVPIVVGPFVDETAKIVVPYAIAFIRSWFSIRIYPLRRLQAY
jgi:hypothetical protein